MNVSKGRMCQMNQDQNYFLNVHLTSGIEPRRNIKFELYAEKGERQQSPLFASCGHSGGWVGRQGLTIGPERNFFVHFFHLNGGQ